MKSAILSAWTCGLLLTGLPFVGGCAQETTPPPPPTNSASQPIAADDSQAQVNPAVVTPTDADIVKPVVPDTGAAADRPLPADVWFSPGSTEIVKMAQAGVEESVMLAFVTNSSSTFNLGSDQIIYLNDLGIGSPVITAMIQRDKELSAGGPQTAAAPTVLTPESEAATVPTAELASAQGAAPAETGEPGQYAPSYATSEPATQTVVNYNYFYDSLAPYGTWVNVDGYGWCWQPTITVIHAGWRPYCDGGRWLYSNAGWYWQSDYTWGSIAFHYGRWFRHARWGWCWWPHRVWAPSWVTWRYFGNYCGWAPLPPFSGYTWGLGLTYYGGSVGINFGFGLNAGCYTFVPWHRFHEHRLRPHRLPHTRVRGIFNRTTVVNNFVQGDNNTIINRGIAVDRVASRANGEIRRVNVRPMPVHPRRPLQPDRVRRERDGLVVYRPAIPTPSGGGRGQDRQARLGPPPVAPESAGSGRAADQAPQPRPERNADAATARARTSQGSVISIGRRNRVEPARDASRPQNLAPTANRERTTRSEETTSRSSRTTFRQNRTANAAVNRPAAPAAAPAPPPAPRQMAPTFNRRNAPARIEPREQRTVRPGSQPTPPTVGQRRLTPAPVSPQPQMSAPPPLRTVIRRTVRSESRPTPPTVEQRRFTPTRVGPQPQMSAPPAPQTVTIGAPPARPASPRQSFSAPASVRRASAPPTPKRSSSVRPSRTPNRSGAHDRGASR